MLGTATRIKIKHNKFVVYFDIIPIIWLIISVILMILLNASSKDSIEISTYVITVLNMIVFGAIGVYYIVYAKASKSKENDYQLIYNMA